MAGVDEIYSIAITSSNLRVQADKRGDADAIMAAGMSPARIGSMLLRLHSEWDTAAKPVKISPEAITQLARTFVGKEAEKLAKAQTIAADWHEHEQKILLSKLKSLPVAREALAVELYRRGAGNARDVGAAILLWWLEKTCRICHGQKFVKIPNTPALSTRRCLTCHGEGQMQPPFGEMGKAVDNWLSECLGSARSTIRRKLQTMHLKQTV